MNISKISKLFRIVKVGSIMVPKAVYWPFNVNKNKCHKFLPTHANILLLRKKITYTR